LRESGAAAARLSYLSDEGLPLHRSTVVTVWTIAAVPTLLAGYLVFARVERA
jgi:hypothetical protein